MVFTTPETKIFWEMIFRLSGLLIWSNLTWKSLCPFSNKDLICIFVFHAVTLKQMCPALFESAAFVHLTVTFAADKMEEGTGWINYKYIGSSMEHWMVQWLFYCERDSRKNTLSNVNYFFFPQNKRISWCIFWKSWKGKSGSIPLLCILRVTHSP